MAFIKLLAKTSIAAKAKLLYKSFWTGLGSDNNWSTISNWSTRVPKAFDDLIFAGTTRLSAYNDLTADTSFKSLAFNANSGAFQLSGNRIIIGNNGFANNSTNTQTINNDVVLSPGNNLVDCSSGPITFAGVLSGTGSIVKSGAQTLNYSGACNYTGQTVINQGAIFITSSSTLNGVISGVGSIIKSGPEILILGGNNTYTGGTTVNGIITPTSSNAFGTGLYTSFGNSEIRSGNSISLPNNFTTSQTLQFRAIGGGTIITIPGIISGSGNVFKTANGTLVLSGANTYIGETNINAGLVIVAKTTGVVTATTTFTNTTLTASFNTPPSIGDSFKFFPGSTAQSYPSVSLIGAPGRTASYNSTTSTLSIIS